MNAPYEKALDVERTEFLLNGVGLSAECGETIIQVAKRHGVDIPHLCYKEGMRADGNCRACMVEIKGERVLAPSCCRAPTTGMEVSSISARALHAQKMIVEMLVADVPERVYKPDSELARWRRWLGIEQPRFAARVQPASDLSHPAMAVNLDACIQCPGCVAPCREEQVNDVIGYAFRGGHSKIVFDLDDPMGDSTCVACGECVQACPTGALMPARDVGKIEAATQAEAVCRYGFDYVQHKHRLTTPLIRKPGVKKHKDFTVDPDDWSDVFRAASWEEALERSARGLCEIRDAHGRGSLAGFGSAKGTNEEAYLFQ